MNKKDYLKNSFLKLKIELDENKIQQFIRYYEILIKKSEVMNLTAIKEFEDVVLKHFVDSVLISQVVNMNQFTNLIDVGTGAGFPGIPLKIIYPELRVTLLDSLNKRINFLDEVIKECKLFHVKTIHGRAEDFGRDLKYRESYDLCVSRAVANLSVLSELCIPFVRKGGYFISYKSDNSEQEIEASKSAIFLTGGKVEKVDEIILPDTDIKRKFIFIYKKDFTSKKYPRKAGTPSKKPL